MMTGTPLAESTTAARAATRVRALLLDSGFTTDGVLARVGSEAFAALGRGLVVPIRRALAERPSDGLLDVLVHAFLLGAPVPAGVLPVEAEADLLALGMLRREGDLLVPEVEVHPYGETDTDWYIASDVGGPVRPDHVLGLGGASVTLARITPRRDCGRALDLGCGAGVQVLHAARHATRVVATDTNPRALALTALTAALSGIPSEQLDLRAGSLYAPVSDERFDLVVSNPPFVISPSHQFTYRDAGLPGDELSRLVVRGAAAHLAPGGMAAVLGNWLHVTGEDWTDRVASWVAGTGVSGWIVERDSQSVADYAATWLRDAAVPEGPEFDEAMGRWLDAFADEAAHEVGFGWVILVAPEAAGDPTWVHVEDLSGSPRLPRGDEVLALLAGCARLEALPATALLASRAHLAQGATVAATTHVVAGGQVPAPPQLGLAGSVGPGGWRPNVTVAPALVAALLGDPSIPLGERLDAAALAEGLDPLDVLGVSLMGLRELVRLGIVRTD